jgi:hypothetical protein
MGLLFNFKLPLKQSNKFEEFILGGKHESRERIFILKIWKLIFCLTEIPNIYYVKLSFTGKMTIHNED